MTVSVIAAVAGNMAIGNMNELLYHIPEDMKRFRRLTLNHTVIMGRKTFESLPSGPLPDRRNIVITRNLGSIKGVETAGSLEEALEMAKSDIEDTEEVFIIGGASVYKEVLEKGLVDRIYLTEVKDVPKEADAFFPPVPDCFDVEWAECHSASGNNPYDFAFVNYVRI